MKRLWKWWWKRQAIEVARRLIEAQATYSVRVMLHGREAYLYARELSEMNGRIEVLIWELERLNGLWKGRP